MARTKVAARRSATFADLKHKKARTKELVFPIGDDEVVITLRSINPTLYDKLIDDAPPNKEQKADGAIYDPGVFSPALISACLEDPQLSFEEAKEIWDSPDWSRGELFALFIACVDICNQGLSVPPTGNGSDTTRPSQ